jgi:hypothetical protein
MKNAKQEKDNVNIYTFFGLAKIEEKFSLPPPLTQLTLSCGVYLFFPSVASSNTLANLLSASVGPENCRIK